MSDSSTTPVRSAHVFDEKALERYLLQNVSGFSGPLSVRQFAGGQSNPTFLLEAGGASYVLRKKPPGRLLPGAHQVDREYRILKALRGSAVPVPEVFALCEDESVIGTAFFVMEHVGGRIFRSNQMPEAASPAERAATFDSMNAVMAALHQVDYRAVGLESYGKPGNYMPRQVATWTKQYLASKAGPSSQESPWMDRLMAWLPGHIPEGDETTIAHGDFRLENLIVHPKEPRVVAVLDWELSTLGHPLADVGYNCMMYHLPPGEAGAVGSSSGLTGLDLKALGIPSEEDYLAAYCRRTGRAGVPDIAFYVAFSLFRLAAIVQGVYKRGLDGNASSETATQYGALVPFLSEKACEVLGGRM